MGEPVSATAGRRETRATGAIPDDRLFVTAPELAAIIRCDNRTVLKMLARGEVPGAFKTGVVWRIPTTWVRQLAGLGGDA